ncbi:ABC transporter substrate-binding protein [Terrarubrum flagellatum]|uniref:ABC transporter substrate-binding protein n=1 Tax=Terrirubrum flagellatum TaxID=2895980 RepID=UPI0031454601
MRRRAFLAGLAALPAGALSESASAQTPVEINFYNYNLATAGLGAEATKKLIQEFMDANPNVRVKGVGVGAADITARVQADVAARRPVDLIQLIFNDMDFAVRSLGAKALEDIIPGEELRAHFEGFAPNGLKLGMLNGKTYGLAYTFSTPVLFYNADLFKRAGLDPERPPQNWADVKQTALTIREKTGKNGFSAGVFGPSAGDWLFQGVIRSNGGEVISRDRKTLKFGEPEAIEAVAMLRDLFTSGAMPNLDINGAMESMASGNLGMYLQTSAVQGFLINGAKDKFELRASTMPTFGEKPVRPNNSGSALVILASDRAKQRAAWELMKFLTSKRGYTVITSEIGYLPLRTDIVDDPRYLGDWVKAHPLVQPNLKQLAVLEPWDSMPGSNYRQIVKTMMDAAEMSVFGGVDVGATLKTAQATAQRLMPN